MSSPRPRRALGRHRALIVLSLIAATCGCTARQDTSPNAEPVPEPALEVANPMAGFAGMVPGEWKTAFPGGTSLFHTWHWGPGRHSIREMTDGSGGGGDPWRELRAMYWHPGRKQVCLLGLSPFAAGVAEGTITFDGLTAEAVVDMHQTGGRRRLSSRWRFDGPDKYHDTLLEATGPAEYSPLAVWDRVRIPQRTATRPPAAEAAAKPPERLMAFESLLGRTWEARGSWVTGNALHLRSVVEWIPLANGIYVRTLAQAAGAAPRHLLDVYVYHHTGTDKLRCLALSDRGAVHEGDLTVLDGGALQLDLTGYEGGRVAQYVVRFDFEKDATLRQRVWSVHGTERTLVLDVQHKEFEPKKD